MPADQFDKDFGYLMPFLDKVTAAAANLSNPSARAELNQLVSEEKRRWTRIRQLLSGTPPSTPQAGNAGPAAELTAAPAASGTKPVFTVGSLRPKRDV